MVIAFICSVSLSIMFFYLGMKVRLLFFSKYLNLFNGTFKQANSLYSELLGLNKFYLSSGEIPSFTEYKFFTGIVNDLIKYYRSFGVDIFDNIARIRSALQQDSTHEKKINALIKGAIFEITLVVMMSWSIAAFAVFHTGLKFELSDLLIVLFMQIFSIVCLFIAIEKAHHAIFKNFYFYIKAVYSIDVLLLSRVAVNEVAQRINLNSLEKDGELNHIKDRIERILMNISKYGKYDKSSLVELINEAWASFEVKSLKFSSIVHKRKLFVIMGVIVPSYLYIFYALLKSLTL